MAPDPAHLDDLYREVILDHYREPCGRAPIEGATHEAEGYNPVCGDECEVHLRIAGDQLEALQVAGRGCAISVASGSILADMLKGLPLPKARELIENLRKMMHGEEVEWGDDPGDLEVLAGLKDYPVRVKCAMLAWTTLESALAGGCGHATTEGTPDDLKEGRG